MPDHRKSRGAILHLECLENRLAPSVTQISESFDTTATGQLPAGWTQWSSTGQTVFATSSQMADSGTHSLAARTTQDWVAAQAWYLTPEPADVEVSANLSTSNAESLALMARASGLTGMTPTYYGLEVVNGMHATLYRMVNGHNTNLGWADTLLPVNTPWIRVTFNLSGSTLRAQFFRLDTAQYLTPFGRWQSDPTWAITVKDSAITSGGFVGFKRLPGLAGTLYADDFRVSASTSNTPASSIPQHYSWIRVAELAYSAGQLDSYAQQLLNNSVDLVVTNWSGLLNQVSSLAPQANQLLYTNISTLYQDLLTDWMNYAYANWRSPEDAFYHVTQATPYSGSSPSSQPVNWFWNVYRTGSTPGDLTAAAHGTTPGQYTTLGGSAGDALYVAYPDRFRQVQVNLVLPASAGWTEQLEYPTAVDANGNPTRWARMSLLGDDTLGLHGHSGWIWFDPPANWVPASINGSARMYYVRFRTLTSGTAPVARSILGADYTGANGGSSGVIPAFDLSADLDHDGYLNDAEYARRQPGMNARFLYQSRVLYAGYGEMRFATNPSNPVFRDWAVNYIQRLVQDQPGTVGVMVDNSLGTPLLVGNGLREWPGTYAQDYASLMGDLTRAVAPRLLLANTTTDSVIANSAGAYEEFSFSALANTWQRFEEVAALVSRQLALRSPSPYLILDSTPSGGSPTDARTQLATLAYYYLLANPTRTFINFFGGTETGTSWTRHWVQAAAYNVGQPLGSWSLLTGGADPESPNKTYQIYQRSYSNALVLYKPLSINPNTGQAGTLDNATATPVLLSGTYRPLQADGTLGAPITRVYLRNGEGAILIKV